MNTFLMWLGGVLIAIFVMLFAGPYFVDWNSYRGVFEEEASRIMGRRVRVGGSVNVRLLPAPYLLFEDLRIADTTGIAGAPLFKTKSFKMWLAVPPLLKGAFEANKVELEEPVLALASDSRGYGNWHTLLDVKSLPFVPTGVKLDSVVIDGGTISYGIEGGGELTRVDKISGELTAQALAGPYSFRGKAEVGGMQSEVRLLTSEASSDGSFRLNTVVSDVANADEHKFDGYVRDLWGMPSAAGQLTSNIRFAEPTSKAGAPLLAEVRSEVTANGQSLELGGLTLSFNEFAQPQIIVGSLKALWARRHRVDLALSSRWLDVDLMATSLDGRGREAPPAERGGDGDSATAAAMVTPLPTARALITQLLNVFPDNTDVTARLDVDQINLGGDRVGGLVVAMEQAGGPLKLETLRAVLPGGARVNFSGNVEAIGGEPVFDGDLFIGGVSAAKIIRWAVGSEDVNSLISDGPFSVGGRLQLGSRRVMLKSAVAEFSGVPIRGGMVWDDERKTIDLEVEGYEIDTRWFGLGKLEIPALAEVLSASSAAGSGDREAGEGENDGGVAGWISAQGRDLKLDLSAGRLTDGKTTLNDVEAQLKLSGGRLEIERVKLVTEEGLSADLKGDLEGIGKAPSGGMDFLIRANDRAAAWKLADLWAGDAASPSDRDRFAAFAPIRIAGRADLGQRETAAADFIFDGSAGGGRIAGELLLDGGIGAWRNASVDFTLRSQSADTAQLFASLSGRRPSPPASGEKIDAGDLLVKVAGIPEKRLLTMVTLDSPEVSLVFDGTTAISDSGVSDVSGELQLRDGDIRKVLRLAGLNLPGGVGKVSYNGLADVSWLPGRFEVSPRDVKLSGARVAGRVVVKITDDDKRSIEGKLVADAGSLPRMLSALLSEPDRAAASVQVARVESELDNSAVTDGEVLESAPQIFSDRAFDLSLLRGVDASLELTTGKLDLGAGMSLMSATTKVRVSEGKLGLDVGGSQKVGGDLKASIEINKAAAGAAAEGSLEMTGAKLASLSLPSIAGGPAGAFGAGTADISLNFKGSGLSPRGMITVMTGNGKLRLKKAVLAGLSPEGVRTAAESILRSEEFSTDLLISELKTSMSRGQLAVGDREAALEVGDGAVQIAAVEVEQKGGRTQVLSTFDLRGFVLDSEYRVTAEDQVSGRAWPPVVVTKVGSLQKLAALEPNITASALERELAVRKMERNVNELERLRRLDEAAAERQRIRERQLELESQRLEAERAAAIAAERANGNASQGGTSAPLPDGWSTESKPQVEGDGLSPQSQGTGNEGGPVSAGGAGGEQAVDAAPAPRPVTRTKRSYRKPKKPKPKSLTNEIFGF